MYALVLLALFVLLVVGFVGTAGPELPGVPCKSTRTGETHVLFGGFVCLPLARHES